MGIEHKPIGLGDRAKMLAVRGLLKVAPAATFEPEGRPAFDKTMAGLRPAPGVAFERAIMGGVSGWWCRPAARSGEAMLYLHGGAYGIGAAWAYRPFVSQIVARSGVGAFVADYALGPERPFPAAFEDAEAGWRALAVDHDRVALIGDSAGGGLALSLGCHLARDAAKPRCIVAMSPWTDLTLSGASVSGRASDDPLLTRAALAAAARNYLGDQSNDDPRASPLFADVAGLPPTLIHVGRDELLLDDATRMVERIEGAGGIADAVVWDGMIHVFPSLYGELDAGVEALDDIARHLKAHLRAG